MIKKPQCQSHTLYSAPSAPPVQGFQEFGYPNAIPPEDFFLTSGLGDQTMRRMKENSSDSPLRSLINAIYAELGVLGPRGFCVNKDTSLSPELLLYACSLYFTDPAINQTKGLMRLHLLAEFSSITGNPMRYQSIGEHTVEELNRIVFSGTMNPYQTKRTLGDTMLISNGITTMLVTAASSYNLGHFRKGFIMTHFSKVEGIEELYNRAVMPIEVPKTVIQEVIRMLTGSAVTRTSSMFEDLCAEVTTELLKKDAIQVTIPDDIALVDLSVNGETYAVVEVESQFFVDIGKNRKALTELDIDALGGLLHRTNHIEHVLSTPWARSETIVKLLNKCSAVSRALTATMAELVRDQSPPEPQSSVESPSETSEPLVGLVNNTSVYRINRIDAKSHFEISVVKEGPSGKTSHYVITTNAPLACAQLNQADTLADFTEEGRKALEVLYLSLQGFMKSGVNVTSAMYTDILVLNNRLESLLKTA